MVESVDVENSCSLGGESDIFRAFYSNRLSKIYKVLAFFLEGTWVLDELKYDQMHYRKSDATCPVHISISDSMASVNFSYFAIMPFLLDSLPGT